MALLERARQFHEDLEVYKRAALKELDSKHRSTKDKVDHQHRLNNLVECIRFRYEDLEVIHTDVNGAFKEEIENTRGKDGLKNFYDQVKQTWAYHTKHPGLPVKNGVDVEEDMKVEVQFSGEEVFGKYLDLHDLFVRWVNLPQCRNKSMDYGQYLDGLGRLWTVQEGEKQSAGYLQYIADLEAYLTYFLKRTQPLVDVDDVLRDGVNTFESAWGASKVPGWPAKAAAADPSLQENSNSANNVAHDPVKLEEYQLAEELQKLGLDRLRAELEARGLKCGGTLQQRAERLISVKGIRPEDIDPKLRPKDFADGSGEGRKRRRVRKKGQVSDDWRKKVAANEARIKVLLEVQSEVWEATKRQVDKKQMRTTEERDAEIKEEELGSLPDLPDVDDESEDEGPIYNPLNLPLGWDGKPIPFWLYKLHGLGVEYKCEICGDYSYWGRRNFDRHFQEWRHAHGMRCLNIPNVKHFHDITLIQDAIDLYAKLKTKIDEETWTQQEAEEYEDRDGNVLSRKTYEDMARQGLL